MMTARVYGGSKAMLSGVRTLIRRSTLFAALGLLGCATPYQDMGFSGGVSSSQMTATTFRISARGNAHTSGAAMEDYALLRAAESTKAIGGTHFLIISAADASSEAMIALPGQARTSVSGNTATTIYQPPEMVALRTPGQDLYIRALTIAPGREPPPGSLSADEIIKHIGGRVKRG